MGKKRISKKHERILQDYQDLVDGIRSNTAIDHSEPLKEQRARKKRLLDDYAGFAKYYFPMWCKGEPASFHINFANELSVRVVCFLIKMWARGLAKSTTVWIAVIWLLVRDDFRFLVFVSYNSDNATELLDNIRAQLEGNQMLIHDFGEFQRYGKWAAGNFQTKKGHAFRSIGRGQTPRGFNVNGQRPDLIIIDDIDDDETSKNPARVEEGYKWLMGALYGTFSTAGKKRFVFVQNLSNNNSILKLAADNPKSEVEQINLVDEHGQPSWKEYHTKDQCDELIETMGYREAQAEYFNNPITEGKIYKKEWIRYKPILPLGQYKQIIVYTDPSWKPKSKNDCKATMMVGLAIVDVDGKRRREYHLLFARVEQTTISKMAEWQYDAYQFLNDEASALFYMEANFVQDLLVEKTQDELDEALLPVFVREDKRKKPDKLARITAMSPAFEKGYFFINESLKGDPHIDRLTVQLTSLEKGSKVADDGPDAIEGAFFLLNEGLIKVDKPLIISLTDLKKHKTKYRY